MSDRQVLDNVTEVENVNFKKATLSAKQSEAIKALMIHPSIEKASDECGVSRRTIYRWLNDPNFSKELRAIQRMTWSGALRHLTTSAADAAMLLVGVVKGEKPSDPVRVTAAKVVLDTVMKAAVLDLHERMDQLERRLNGEI